MSAEGWNEIVRWIGIGGLLLLILSAAPAMAAFTAKPQDPASKAKRDKAASMTAVLLSTGVAVMLAGSNMEFETAGRARVAAIVFAALAALYVAAQLHQTRQALRLVTRRTPKA